MTKSNDQPIRSNGKTVLITGINGYIAAVLGQMCLADGYHVRGTTRSKGNVESLLNGSYDSYGDRVEIFEVQDIKAAGAFDAAVQGVHGIFHVASPVSNDLRTWETVVEPAVRGTMSLLESALAHAGPQLQAVVVTSSGAAMISPNPPSTGYVFTEEDRNEWAVSAARTITDDWPADKASGVMYAASKTVADEAMWKFFEEMKPKFSMSSVHPAVTIGPPAHLPASWKNLSVSLMQTYKIYAGVEKELPPPIGTSSYVDVRDVAAMHLWAFKHPDLANGQRYLASGGYGPAQGIADLLRKHFPDNHKILVGEPGKGYKEGIDFSGNLVPVWYPDDKPQISGKKVVDTMGIQWLTLEQSLIDTVKIFQQFYGN